MENRDSASSSALLAKRPGLFDFRISILVLCFIAGCGAPGEPTPPSPPVPTAVTDLSVRQSGDGALLTFTLPTRTILSERLTEPPAVEIFRGWLKPDGNPDNNSFRLVYTLPGALLDVYTTERHIQFKDPVAPEETRAHPGATLAYRVRTRAAKKRASSDSNTVTVRIFSVPERATFLEARVTESAIELAWLAPKHTSGGAPLDRLTGYRVFRGELDPSSAEAAVHDVSQAKWKTPLLLLAPAPENSHRDTLFEFDKTYLYIVRSVALTDDGPVESDDSIPAVVTPRDTFPPAIPQNVVAAVTVPPGGSAVVDLSFSINLENDLAGYRVYRSGQQDSRGQLLTADLLLAPAYRDMSVQLGHHYWYTVTAVDRAGNESIPSPAVSADLTQLLP